MAIFDKTDFLDLKYPPEVQVEPKTCIAIFRTPVPAILNHKNSTGLAGKVAVFESTRGQIYAQEGLRKYCFSFELFCLYFFMII